MDIADLPKGLWPVLVRKWREGETLDGREIEEAFNWEDDDMPAYVKPLLKALIDGEVKLKRGRKSEWPEWAWQSMIRSVEFFRREIEYYKKHGECDHLAEYPDLEAHVKEIGDMQGSALTLAIDTTAAQHGVSYEALEKRRKRYMRTIKARAVRDKI